MEDATLRTNNTPLAIKKSQKPDVIVIEDDCLTEFSSATKRQMSGGLNGNSYLGVGYNVFSQMGGGYNRQIGGYNGPMGGSSIFGRKLVVA